MLYIDSHPARIIPLFLFRHCSPALLFPDTALLSASLFYLENNITPQMVTKAIFPKQQLVYWHRSGILPIGYWVDDRRDTQLIHSPPGFGISPFEPLLSNLPNASLFFPSPQMRFLSIRLKFRLQFPSYSLSQRMPLLFSYTFSTTWSDPRLLSVKVCPWHASKTCTARHTC